MKRKGTLPPRLAAALLVCTLSTGCAAQNEFWATTLGGLAGYGVADALDLGQGEAAAAAVAGAMIGNQMYTNRTQNPGYGYPAGGYSNRPYYNHCSHLVPAQYGVNTGVRESWIKGCENKMYQNQVQAEQAAYQNAINTQ